MRASLFLSVFGLGTLLPLFTALVSVKDSEQQWTMVAFFPAAIAFGQMAETLWDRSKALRVWFEGGVGVSALALVLINLHMHTELLVAAIPADRYDPKVDIANELVGWDELRPRIEKVAHAAPGEVVLASNHYSLCGRLWFEMKDAPPVYCVSERRTEFDFMERRTPPPGASVLSVTNAIHDIMPPELAERGCTLEDTVEVERAGRKVARYDFRFVRLKRSESRKPRPAAAGCEGDELVRDKWLSPRAKSRGPPRSTRVRTTAGVRIQPDARGGPRLRSGRHGLFDSGGRASGSRGSPMKALIDHLIDRLVDLQIKKPATSGWSRSVAASRCSISAWCIRCNRMRA